MTGIGLLWYDSSAQNLAVKIAAAARRYRERFGGEPNVCYVHPSDLPTGECETNGIRVRTATNVLRHHLWLGNESSEVTQ
ncbi:MAG: hypothetical protein J7M17_07380 [Anaerolineae bacterium]|nr:hypothetical protein [Anaerolineae bacterium]